MNRPKQSWHVLWIFHHEFELNQDIWMKENDKLLVWIEFTRILHRNWYPFWDQISFLSISHNNTQSSYYDAHRAMVNHELIVKKHNFQLSALIYTLPHQKRQHVSDVEFPAIRIYCFCLRNMSNNLRFKVMLTIHCWKRVDSQKPPASAEWNINLVLTTQIDSDAQYILGVNWCVCLRSSIK